MKKTVLLPALMLVCCLTFGQGKSEWVGKPFGYQVWKGEKVNAEAVFLASEAISGLTLEAGELTSRDAVISSGCIKADFLSYVIGDELLPQYNQCGARDTVNFKAMKAADLIGGTAAADLAEGESRRVWLSISIPADAKAGKYSGSLSFCVNDVPVATLPYSVVVVDKLLPPLSESPFHLDLWQNPYAVARYHNVPLWSPEHFEHLRPVMKMLADAGQKVITATIMDRPWNGQTEDPFGPMVTKIRRADGSWLYDYTVFDLWVEFMMSLGIDGQINCYTMIPWALSFDYFDQAANCCQSVRAVPGSAEYDSYWKPFLNDFATHLRGKGWFDRTYIAMDERPEDLMKAALKLIKDAEPGFKVALAGNYHESIADDIDDLCITLGSRFPDGVIEARRAAGKISTYYTCCSEKYPNTFMACNPFEASWLPWLALARGEDGYLRWAFNSWTADPVRDSRFRTWAAGDCYMVYPDGVSSVRFERLVEGLQDYAKARILLDEWGAGSKKAAKLVKALRRFTVDELSVHGPEPALNEARKAMNL